MTTGFVWHESYAWHDAGRASQNRWVEPHPALDRPETKRRLQSLVAASGLLDLLAPIPARVATREELVRFHTPTYVDRIAVLGAGDGGDAGESARFGPGGFELARLAVGGCLEAVDAVLEGRVDNAYALVRPCGHHAEADRGRGFCVFGNVALAVKHAQAMHGIERIAVVDWDVHHGNGTEDAFYEDPSVLTISLHQDACYPVERGRADDIGRGAGRGFNLNVPLPPGSGHGAYIEAFDRVVSPAIHAFDPQLIFVSAGSRPHAAVVAGDRAADWLVERPGADCNRFRRRRGIVHRSRDSIAELHGARCGLAAARGNARAGRVGQGPRFIGRLGQCEMDGASLGRELTTSIGCVHRRRCRNGLI
jgi:acetoin utilization deacetylase AcuC-like enzyme